MRLRFLPLMVIAVVLSVGGCGGTSSLGKNSDMVVHLKRTDGT